MSIQELKSQIHQLVDTVEDETLLEQVNQLLSSETEADILDDLTDEQLAKIEEAREEVRRGNYVSLTEHKRKIEQWLAARR